MEVVEASPDLAPMLASYAKECFDSGIPKYENVELNPETYLSGLIDLRQPPNYQMGICQVQRTTAFQTLKS